VTQKKLKIFVMQKIKNFCDAKKIKNFCDAKKLKIFVMQKYQKL
jgi:hypothetical protein